MRDEYRIKQRYYLKNPCRRSSTSKWMNFSEMVWSSRPGGHLEHPLYLWLKRRKRCELNAKVIPDAYPLPWINHILEKLKDAKYISMLDLKSGYWQIPMARISREYTAFTVPGRRLFHWKVMLFGLCTFGPGYISACIGRSHRTRHDDRS